MKNTQNQRFKKGDFVYIYIEGLFYKVEVVDIMSNVSGKITSLRVFGDFGKYLCEENVKFVNINNVYLEVPKNKRFVELVEKYEDCIKKQNPFEPYENQRIDYDIKNDIPKWKV